MSQPSLFVVSGPSGSGKTTICRRIADQFNWYYSVSHTTRPIRPGEHNGRDYFFVNEAEFKDMVAEDAFFEWARVYDNFYGTAKEPVMDHLQKGQSVILDLDTQGAALVKKLKPEAVLVFINTPSVDELETRLKSRGQNSEDEIKKRVQGAQNELSHIDEYDHVILNDDLDSAIAKLQDIINEHRQQSKTQ
ncbi:MAG: guanylate kinase [Deltaproteobacteria bacterium]|nr:guanylate kinase [Deltaproteobacteria bacterium]